MHLKFETQTDGQYNTIQPFIALSTHIQHFKQTNIYTIHENTIFGGT